MRIEAEPGFLLHSTPYRDTSLLVGLYTANHGRVRCVAKGFRKPNKQGINRSIFPYTEHQFSWQGRGELKTLTRADVVQTPIFLSGESLFTGLYVNELFYRLFQEQEVHLYLYQQYQQFMSILCKSLPDELQLRQLEMTLLEELGYGLVLDSDAESGAPLQADQFYQYIPEQGLQPSLNQREGMPGSYLGEDLLNISRGEFARGSAQRTAKLLLRSVINFYLDGRQLHSRELYRQHLMSKS